MEVTDWAPNPEQLYWASELRDILTKCLEELSPILRTVFVLLDIEGLTIDQTAEVLDVSHSAVKARLWRARLQLREGLNKYFSKRPHPERAQSFPSGLAQLNISITLDQCRRVRHASGDHYGRHWEHRPLP